MKVRIVHGSLEYKTNTTFFTGASNSLQISPVLFNNKFNGPVEFLSANINDKNFEILNFTKGTVLKPNVVTHILTIQFLCNDTTSNYKTSLNIDTNITKLFVPLHLFHGRLEYIPFRWLPQSEGFYSNKNFIDEEEEENSIEEFDKIGISNLNFGIVLPKEKKIHRFLLNNPNPVPISIYDWYFENLIQKNSISISLEKIFENEETEKNKIEEVLIDNIFNSNTFNQKRKKNTKLLLKSGFQGLFKIEILENVLTENEERGTLVLKTEFQDLKIPFTYSIMKGELIVSNNLKFGSTFPGIQIIKSKEN
jgi:hypothetical protein